MNIEAIEKAKKNLSDVYEDRGRLSGKTLVTCADALNQMAERMKGCEYCNDPNMPTLEADCMNHKDWHYHFCPMCGRRLEVEHE